MVRIAPLLIFALSACGEKSESNDVQTQADRDLAIVEEINNAQPPIKMVDAEAILYPDIEANALYGSACNYAPGTSIGTRVIARQDDAIMKLEGEIMRFAADAGSAKLPLETRAIYAGKEYVLELSIDGDGKPSGRHSTDYQGTIALRDSWGRVVYTATGLAQCSG